MNETQNPGPAPIGGSKLSTIFLVVLGLHIVLILAFSAYHLLKGGGNDDSGLNTASESVEEAPLPETPAVVEKNTQPTVETQADGTESVQPAEVPGDQAALPMPSSSDPIWTRVPAPSDTAVTAGRNETQPVTPPATEPARTAPPRVEMSVNEKSHTVAKGDSLARIARQYGVTVAELKAANNMTGDLIRIGQVVQVPSVRSSSPAVATAPVAAPTVPKAVPVARRAEVVGGSYTVGKGDTLWKIARQFNVKPQDLASANGITDPSKLKVGMVLRLPGSVQKQDLAQPPARPEPVPVNTDMAMVPAGN